MSLHSMVLKRSAKVLCRVCKSKKAVMCLAGEKQRNAYSSMNYSDVVYEFNVNESQIYIK